MYKKNILLVFLCLTTYFFLIQPIYAQVNEGNILCGYCAVPDYVTGGCLEEGYCDGICIGGGSSCQNCTDSYYISGSCSGSAPPVQPPVNPGPGPGNGGGGGCSCDINWACSPGCSCDPECSSGPGPGPGNPPPGPPPAPACTYGYCGEGGCGKGAYPVYGCSSGCIPDDACCTEEVTLETYNQCGAFGSDEGNVHTIRKYKNECYPDDQFEDLGAVQSCGNGCSGGVCNGQPPAIPIEPPPQEPPPQIPQPGNPVCDSGQGICGCSENCRDGENTDFSCCHRECVGASCVTVSGAGANSCNETPNACVQGPDAGVCTQGASCGCSGAGAGSCGECGGQWCNGGSCNCTGGPGPDPGGCVPGGISCANFVIRNLTTGISVAGRQAQPRGQGSAPSIQAKPGDILVLSARSNPGDGSNPAGGYITTGGGAFVRTQFLARNKGDGRIIRSCLESARNDDYPNFCLNGEGMKWRAHAGSWPYGWNGGEATEQNWFGTPSNLSDPELVQTQPKDFDERLYHPGKNATVRIKGQCNKDIIEACDIRLQCEGARLPDGSCPAGNEYYNLWHDQGENCETFIKPQACMYDDNGLMKFPSEHAGDQVQRWVFDPSEVTGNVRIEATQQRVCTNNDRTPCAIDVILNTPSPTPEPWFRLKDTQLWRLGGVTNKVPANATKFDSEDTETVNTIGGSAGSALSSGAVNFGAGQVSDSKWLSQEYQPADPLFSLPKARINNFTGQILAKKTFKEIDATVDASLSGITSNGIYEITTNGTLQLNATNFANISGKKLVLVVRGSVEILPSSGSDFLPSNLVLIAAGKEGASGVIRISPNLATIRGIFAAEQFETGISNAGLKIIGNVITSQFINKRSNMNNNKPSTFVVFDTAQLIEMMPYIGGLTYKWTQIE